MALRAQTGPYFGDFGGRFVPESLVAALDELGEAYDLAKLDPAFGEELAELGRSYTGRPSIITEVPRFAAHAGGARIILKRDGEDLVLAYVGHHNDAYAWAERRKITRHERTGAMQIVEVIEQKAAGKLFDWTAGVSTDEPAPAGQAQPFWSLSDDDMLDVGVPRDWLQPVREMVEDELDRTVKSTPFAEASL